MARTITIDRIGRLVIPKDVRERHRLRQGSRLRLHEHDNAIVLEPLQETAPLIERNGYLVIGGEPTDEAIDHRQVRDERLAKLSRLGD